MENSIAEIGSIRELFESDGKSYEAVKFIAPDRLLVWDKSGKATSDTWTGMTGWNIEVCRVMNLKDIELVILKSMKVYDLLSTEVKDEMEHIIRVQKDQTKELMAKARAGRKKKYENIPKEIECSVCHKTIEAIPSKIAKIVEKSGVLLVDYLANFKCRSCSPIKHRGKVANPNNTKYPKKMKCGCGEEVNTNITYLRAKAEKLGKTIEELIANFKCQGCEKTPRGRKKQLTCTE